jgi:hypothetical protein
MKRVKHYSHNYIAYNNARVTGKIFKEWLLCFERKMACKNRNGLLLLDQSSVYNYTTSYMHPLM